MGHSTDRSFDTFGVTKKVLLALALTAGGCVAEADPGAAGLASEDLSHGPTPVIFDGDMGFDDAAALAYLCEEHHRGEIDLLAVSVDNNGVGFPGSAIRHARCVLQACGLTDVPVADGSTDAEHTVPIELRGAMEVILDGAFADCTADGAPAAIGAGQLIHDTLRDSHRRVTVITMGSFTNLDDALELDDQACNRGRPVENRIERVYSMAGAIDVPGNLFGDAAVQFDNTQETNVWVDPASAQDVLDRLRPGTLWLVPLDATNYVPITAEYATRIANDRTTPAAEVVHSILSQPIMQFGIQLGGFYWWDPLAAVSATRNHGITDFDRVRISIVQSGPSAGRTLETRRGAQVYAGVYADRTRFENAFIDGLNGRVP